MSSLRLRRNLSRVHMTRWWKGETRAAFGGDRVSHTIAIVFLIFIVSCDLGSVKLGVVHAVNWTKTPTLLKKYLISEQQLLRWVALPTQPLPPSKKTN